MSKNNCHFGNYWGKLWHTMCAISDIGEQISRICPKDRYRAEVLRIYKRSERPLIYSVLFVSLFWTQQINKSKEQIALSF